jgi:hypothetical protein
VAEENMRLKLGFVIIGSLFWDAGPDDMRKTWRENRLMVDKAIDVQLPIRYGRLSQNDTYTMVFSTSAPHGSAKVVPCRQQINDFADLQEEALNLWRAESKEPDSKVISASWGCVALLLRNNQNQDYFSKWSELTSKNPSRYKIATAKNEAPLLSPEGIMQMAWPTKISGDALTEVDALLAVVNRPTLTPSGKYATPDDIAKAWLTHKDRDRYFYQNRAHGIKTFEDESILEEFWKASTGAC